MTYEARSGSNLLENISNHSEGANTGLDVVYSCIEDDWTLCSSDIICQIKVLSDLTGKDELLRSKSLTIYRGVRRPCEFQEFLSVDNLLDSMKEAAADENDFAEDYLENVTEEHSEELREMIVNWAEEHGYKPDFFFIKNLEKIEVQITDEIRSHLE